jgi:hypothetical protein
MEEKSMAKVLVVTSGKGGVGRRDKRSRPDISPKLAWAKILPKAAAALIKSGSAALDEPQ